MDRYSNLAALTLLVSVAARSILRDDRALNIPVIAAIVVAIMLATAKRSLLTVVILSAATAAAVRLVLPML